MAEARRQFGNPEEGERLPLKAVTTKLMKRVKEDFSSVCNPDL
jgi:hypothetical protein